MDSGNSITAAVISGLQDAVLQHKKAWLVTTFLDEHSSTGHGLVRHDGSVIGELPSGLTVESIQQVRLPARVMLEERQVMIEPVSIAGTTYIFGAGHVSRSLAEFVKAVGFWTVVLDDRADYANRDRFPAADEIVVLDSFDEVMGNITIDRDSFVVIVTRGHLNDRTVLSQVLKSNAGYIGMIGSRRKCGLIFDELRRSGYPEAEIQRVHAPIGISIDAETPEEIGISITAEMIAVRAGLQKES
jgi:xanthine dehydrogenase accessory factor